MSRIDGLIGRRNFLQGAVGSGLVGAIALTASIPPALAAETDDNTPLSPDAALQKLLAGNQRFVKHKAQYPHQSAGRLKEVALSQHPFATILACADSRVPVEILFDEGVGDLFDVRVAGNIVTPEVLGSVEYAAALLGTSLVMVLGHERCGAVTAAVKDESVPGSIGSLITAIKPAIATIKDKSGDLVEQGVVENVRYQVELMQKRSPVLAQLVTAGKLKVVGGRYDLDTGEVTIVT